MSFSRTKEIARHFDKAVDYDSASVIQKETAQKLADLLSQNVKTSPTTILEIGCGTGHLTEKLLTLYPTSTHIITDISPEMLKRAEQKIKQGGFSETNILFHQMDGETLKPPPPFHEVSLIISNLCIQWFPDISPALKLFAEYLAPEGTICLTTLAYGSFHEWRIICKNALISCGIPDYPELSSLQADWPLGGHGEWFIEAMKEKVLSSHDFLRNLKKIGASLPRLGHNPPSAPALRKAMTLFDKTYDEITYQVAFGMFHKD